MVVGAANFVGPKLIQNWPRPPSLSAAGVNASDVGPDRSSRRHINFRVSGASRYGVTRGRTALRYINGDEVEMSNDTPEVSARPMVYVPISSIRRERQPWHTRVYISTGDIDRLARAIDVTKIITPITVISLLDGTYDYVSGLLRILACENLGVCNIPAFVEDSVDPVFLLRSALIEQDAHFPLLTLERGWALKRLQDLSTARGKRLRQSDLSHDLGIDPGTVSEALGAERVIGESAAEQVAVQFGIEPSDIAGLPRSAIRQILRASKHVGYEQLMHDVGSAIAQDENVERFIKSRYSTPTADEASVGEKVAAEDPLLDRARRLYRVWKNGRRAHRMTLEEKKPTSDAKGRREGTRSRAMRVLARLILLARSIATRVRNASVVRSPTV